MSLKSTHPLICLIEIFFLLCFFVFGISYAGQTVDLDGVTISTNIAGNGIGANGSAPFNEEPNNNIMNVVNAIINGGSISGGLSANRYASSNTVSVSASKISTNTNVSVYGGYTSGDGIAKYNIVDVDGISAAGIEKSILDISGGYINGNGNAQNNKLSIYLINGAIDSSIHIICGWVRGNGNAEGNEISIYGISTSENSKISIIGGQVDGGNGNAINNTIHMYGNIAAYGSNSTLAIIGGISSNNEKTGNILDLMTDKECNATIVDNFGTYRFYLYGGIVTPNYVALSFKNGLSANEGPKGVDISNVNIYTSIELFPNSILRGGDSLTLMHCDSTFLGDFESFKIFQEFYSLSKVCKSTFTIELLNENKDIVATLLEKKIKARDEAESYLCSRAGLVKFLSQGYDLLSRKEIIEVFNVQEAFAKELQVFGIIESGESKYKVSEELKINGYSGAAGIGKMFDKMSTGIFFEFGKGSYRLKNKFDSGEVNANGNNTHVGGGLLFKRNFGKDHNRLSGIYLDGLFRIGNAKTGYKTNDIKATYSLSASKIEEVSYDYSSLYYGLNLGWGYKYQALKKLGLEGCVRYTLLCVPKKEVVLPDKEKIKFESITENSLIVGVKCQYEVKPKVEPYIGIAVEQKLGGKLKAKAEEFPIKDVDLKGTVGIGDIGTKIDINEKLRIDLEAQGFIGNRKGFAGILKVTYIFRKLVEDKKTEKKKVEKLEIKNVLFEFDKSRITPEAEKEIKALVEKVKKKHNNNFEKIRIEGHTDSEGSDWYNMRLSSARAKAVRDVFVKYGIPAEKVENKGYGSMRPLVPNHNKESKAKNRRVEVFVDWY
jgi:outer membrane protein OmpA-like peptidoglycan-associated protein